ncbi:hypothetical protein GRI43_07705 [Altererythrobacter luteolus]|uniref:Uncharacterized protein n=1 Tax=Pontixanthobacter luteolus TaxID=295089 RepID=A0A6I4V0P1_9SPHN|nr:hypothetical protein [Pontixanthobacter luteolus]MXP47275.1 hypothetical protein [Pontixanthobacter luteolus]
MVVNVGVTLASAAALLVAIYAYFRFAKNDVITSKAVPLCSICQRKLDVDDDPLSIDCGGDCWGCVGQAELGGELDSNVREEIATGLRRSDGSAADRKYGV